jgi:hypothetical protein
MQGVAVPAEPVGIRGAAQVAGVLSTEHSALVDQHFCPTSFR